MGINRGNPAAILMIQKQGSAINVNPHGHLVAADGLFVCQGETRTLDFEPLPPPSNEELQALLDRVISRTIALYQKTYGPDDVYLDPDELPVAHAISDALRAPVTPSSADELPQDELHELKPQNELCLQKDGFSLHARRFIQDTDRKGLERLLRYAARAPMAGSRLSIDSEKDRFVQNQEKLRLSAFRPRFPRPMTFVKANDVRRVSLPILPSALFCGLFVLASQL